jgi:hypothetical protein
MNKIIANNVATLSGKRKIMSENTVYTWEIQDKAGAAIPREHHLNDLLFVSGRPVDEAVQTGQYADWASAPARMELDTIMLENGKKWYREKHPIQCWSNNPKEAITKYDFISTIFFVPTVSHRVYEAMKVFCPDDFEAFDIVIDTPTGPLEGYKLINITNRILGAVDLEKSVMRGGYWVRDSPDLPERRVQIDTAHIKQFYADIAAGRETVDELWSLPGIISYLTLKEDAMQGHHLGRLAENNRACMFSQELIDVFRKMKAKGFAYMSLEDYENQLYGGIVPGTNERYQGNKKKK